MTLRLLVQHLGFMEPQPCSLYLISVIWCKFLASKILISKVNIPIPNV